MATNTTPFGQGNIDPESWDRLKAILADALEQNSSAARIALVEQRCGEDTHLLEEAESLLAEAEALLNESTDSFEDCAQNAASTLWQEGPQRGGQRVGAYVIVRELGRGGMGTVFLAERADGQFEKQVAIKILNRGADTAEILRRFRAERQILAELDHPNIARLLDAGTTDDGLPYFIMDYIVGAPVTRYAAAQGLSTRQRLELFLKICAAVEFAHRNLVVHRDIKPSNILANAEGEPKLLDFGIAKLLAKEQDAAQLTSEAQQHLTPVCASPEQAKGEPITVASDIYSLGALLYEMLSDQRPHRFSTARPTREELALVVAEQVPPPPSAVASDPQTARLLRGDLDAIVLFAMHKEPGMRYATVADLADDVRRHLAREPVVARHPTLGYRAKCLVKRNRSRLLTGATVAFVLAGVLFAYWTRSQQNARGAESLRARGGGPPASDTRKSIAVLPFEGLGDNNSPSYFADGVQDNILTDLGKVRDLKVISRSGVAPYRGKKRNIKQIGRDLDVANVLEGSVQISGDRVRINAQLVDTETDSQIWAERYDRKLEDIFALQSELAQTIAGQLKATLSLEEKAKIWRQPTQDLAAYDLYLRARAVFRSGGPNMPRETWNEAISLLNKAIARDQKFTLAYCLLNEVYVLLYRFGDHHSPEHLAAAKDAAETALRLEPKSEEAHLALARYYYHGLGDYRRTQRELSTIPSSASHEVEFFTLASLVQRRLGQFAASIRNGEKAVELDPQNAALAVSLAQTYSGLRRFGDSDRVLNAAIARVREPRPARLFVAKHEAALGKGNIEEARAALDSAPDKNDMDYQSARLWLYFMERDYSAAKPFAANAADEAKKVPDFWLTLAAIAHVAGKADEERQANEEARRLALVALGPRPNDPNILGQLSIAEAGLGQNGEAVRHARQAAETLPPNVDAVLGPSCEMRLAEVLVMIGDRDGAFDALGNLVKLPFGANQGDLKLNPMWDDLRNDSRFDRILAESALPLAPDVNLGSTRN
ncbi:MAG TPA: protein kinase [Candidatus Udaeobacter sp.]|nr:protein kinase [Candidatus Udaeobacter sp.]